ncbi:ABC transporter permease [Cardiobacterium sp. Marseille-Q4385]|uniref:ABC transporter permease n=1 Tax=Cardiobacterium sp. Marseille-Q4385 TaxID=2866573 RepID=UPI001CE3DB2C|nr:ABC transporter permease [Cardiobacterium sp. Marseille-Q4385]
MGVTDNPAAVTNASTIPLNGANPANTPLDAANPVNTSLDGANPATTPPDAANPATPLSTSTLRYWFATTWTFARREGTELLRDHVRTFFALFGPIILMTAITWGVSFDIKNLTYAVLDHDHSAESRAIIEPLAGSRYFNELSPLTDESQLLDRLASREAKLTIDIPPNFGRDLLRERRPEIHYHIDGAESFNAANINAYIPAILAAYTHEQTRARGIALPPPAASLEPRYAYNQDFKSVNAIAPGVLMLALTLFPAMMAAVGVVREREIGSIANYYTSPASRLQYLVGKQLPYIATAMLSFAILYLMMRYWFGLPMKGSLAALTLATLLMSCTSTAIGLLFSTFTRSQVAAIFLTAIATIMPALNFSGFLVPVSALEGGAHIFGKIIPSTWYAVTTTGTFSKGLGVHELHREILLLALYYALFLTAACLNLKKQEK